jgi:hypothetical protein
MLSMFNATNKELQMQTLPQQVEERNGRFFVKMGFAGFNSRANNRSGFETAAAALKSHQRFASRGPKLPQWAQDAVRKVEGA